ncbi:fimbria/pilus periplasmic chaperone [Enterobacter quasiroggenkampii]|uniref:fimbria/pilus periplasmic chaperone n=1 Tax=Enterobacter quasiroggenkampii TaxID=2497436 RepID=UPI0023DE8D88|nr:fimbria/pilus periplasmic chaperone [Enterobacter quasiroggenkampii]MCU6306348.1 fimbria/pilus periplasmic chaperone [Enterobacter quasiroggenkampii]MCU6398428.1 fimbria/pilus periplasmic chaperone [Enterobacter quasiroggenkampii]
MSIVMNKTKRSFIATSVAASLVCGLISSANAGGVALGATRLIYPQGDKQISLPITNSDTKDVFLIQNWVSDGEGKKINDFIITPPLFVIQPKKENILRIMYVGQENLPQDRETVFYLNSKAIPSTDKSKQSGSSLQIATQSVIKLFIRPKKLPTPSVDAPKTLRCQVSGGNLTVTNPSPYYVTLVQLHVGDKKIDNDMVPPKGSKVINTQGAVGSVTFQTMNDYGAMTAKQSCGN